MRLRLSPLCLVIETQRFIPRQFRGCSLGPLVLIRPGTSAGLLAHELTHVRQFWRRPLTHLWRYHTSPRYRQECEVEAYRAQLEVSGWKSVHVMAAAGSLARLYGLSLPYGEARRLLEP